MKVTLLNAEELKQYPAERWIGLAASICYDSNPKNPERIAIHCIESGHGSPQRFADFKFLVQGVSRVESHQHVRHGVGVAHNQMSQRYVDQTKMAFILPPSIAVNNQAAQIFQDATQHTKQAYIDMIALGIPIEDARYVLSQAGETALVTTFSVQALIHFCHERLCNRSQWEIRNVAEAMVQEVYAVSPIIAKYLVPKCSERGYCSERECCGIMPRKKDVLAAYQKSLK